uniref:Pentraxin family member n=1 Tax=Callorhinchus milii TaxID=7868 RepID=K4GKZ0_CALMI|nr:pentraxin [Callorhinchus milii]
MKTLVIFLAIIMAASAAFSKGLLMQSLNFPMETDDSYVKVQPNKPMGLTAFTLCAKILTDAGGVLSIFSYATQNHNNELLLGRETNGKFSLHLSGPPVLFDASMAQVGWTPLCVTWESKTGMTALWVNGTRSVRKKYQTGRTLEAGGVIILGQDQDNVQGGFQKKECFIGEMTDIHLWDYILVPSEIRQRSRKSINPRGNVIDWNTMKYEAKGTVIVSPSDIYPQQN